MNKVVTTVLSVYKRLEHLGRQYQAIKNQTIESDIWVDYTVPDGEQMYDLSSIVPEAKITIRPNHNLFHIGRFYHALNIDSKYTFICDDDQLPGEDYLKACINYIEQNGDCIIGGYGVRLDPLFNGYLSKENYGWGSIFNGGNKEVQKVDMIGHSWFMKTKYLKVIAYETPNSRKNGEDLFFSYMTQKYSQIPLVVLPHTKENPKEWSSDPDFALKVGNDLNATALMSNHQLLRDLAVREYRNKGWKLILEL